ncbi:hypothetical protein BHE74_00031867 [Ensete ventricosum]|nr:hypothetical protein GW17_00048195 [Ensete ventricosum]RWW61094.1 hypothetical protein BHE74_00031867 [Ensete ventricosum]RZR86196.1 hypothetical protein BHM03_00013342 [Ensete ventricosum]
MNEAADEIDAGEERVHAEAAGEDGEDPTERLAAAAKTVGLRRRRRRLEVRVRRLLHEAVPDPDLPGPAGAGGCRGRGSAGRRRRVDEVPEAGVHRALPRARAALEFTAAAVGVTDVERPRLEPRDGGVRGGGGPRPLMVDDEITDRRRFRGRVGRGGFPRHREERESRKKLRKNKERIDT